VFVLFCLTIPVLCHAAKPQGADPWAVDKLGGRTALHYAATRDSVEVTAALLEAVGEQCGAVRFPNRPNTRWVACCSAILAPALEQTCGAETMVAVHYPLQQHTLQCPASSCGFQHITCACVLLPAGMWTYVRSPASQRCTLRCMLACSSRWLRC
jgi:hypothetical protein